MTILALGGAACYGAAGLSGPAPGGLLEWLGGLGLILATALWHEFGHAAALRREGYPPGAIGAGVLFVIPVLWADVTPVTALPRGRRMRVDLAGVCFQLAAGGVCAVLAGAGGAGAAAWGLGAAGALAAVTWSLLPFMRTDGYWALCDLLGVDNLDGPPPAGSSRRLARFVAMFRVANALFLIWVVAAVPWRVLGLAPRLAALAGLDPQHPAVRAAAMLVAGFLLASLGLGASRRLRSLLFS